jgi:hypothetical protein
MLADHWQKSSYCGEGESCIHVSADWQKSSHCQEGDACIHVSADKQRSTYCGEGDACIHATSTPTGAVNLTESSDPTGAILTLTPAAFATLLRSIKQSGTAPGIKQPGTVPAVEVTASPDGSRILLEDAGVVVTTTPAQWDAFRKGVQAGEFDHFARTS